MNLIPRLNVDLKRVVSEYLGTIKFRNGIFIIQLDKNAFTFIQRIPRIETSEEAKIDNGIDGEFVFVPLYIKYVIRRQLIIKLIVLTQKSDDSEDWRIRYDCGWYMEDYDGKYYLYATSLFSDESDQISMWTDTGDEEITLFQGN